MEGEYDTISGLLSGSDTNDLEIWLTFLSKGHFEYSKPS